MTWRGTAPTRSNREAWTAWERSQEDPSQATDFDACSCMHGRGIWPNIGDVESLTILAELESVESDSA